MTPGNVMDVAQLRRRASDREPRDGTKRGRRASDRMPTISMGLTPVEVTHTPVVTDSIEVSVVMPCLNEEKSVGVCVEKAIAGIAASGRVGEVIVCDNGSSDNSVEVAEAAGASVVREPARGYGNAYMTGFRAARGKLIVMGDSDDSYDFTQLNVLVDKIGEGFDYVLGSRFGGEIRQGAMTWSHRYIGNPILTAVLNRFFGLKSSDAHSGMRAFTREALDRMALRCEGMEFASEIVVKAARANLRVAEVPIVYHPRIGESKLNTMRDGWRHLRFLLLLSPIYLFLIPGMAMFTAGAVGQGIDLTIGGRGASTNLSILSALLAVTGVVTIIFGIFTQTFLQGLGFQKPTRVSNWLDQNFSLERNLVVSMAAIGTGLVIDVLIWVNGKSNELGGAKWSVASVMLVAIGVVILFGSFFLSIFRVRIHAIDKAPRSEEF